MVYTPEVMKLIHIFAIFIFGPLLIMVGMLGKKTPPFFLFGNYAVWFSNCFVSFNNIISRINAFK